MTSLYMHWCAEGPSQGHQFKVSGYGTGGKQIHLSCHSAETTSRTHFNKTKGPAAWRNLPKHEKDEIVVTNAKLESERGKARGLVTEIEKMGVTDSLGLNNRQYFMNQFEFCDHLKTRWRIDDEDQTFERT